MTEWGVVLVVASLITLISGVTVPVVKLNSSITRFSVVLDGVEKDMTELKAEHEKDIGRVEREGNDKRKRIHEKIERLEGTSSNHEIRITKLEGK